MDQQQQSQTKGDPSLDDVPRETLIELLRDKGRENQKIQKRLDKLQEKYVQVFKESKLITKDREVMEKVLHSFLNEEPYLLGQKAIGQYEQQGLFELCQRREDEKQKTLSSLMTATNREKCELEERYKQMSEKQIQGMDQQIQSVMKQLKTQIHDLEQNNTRLAKEIIELNDIIQMKNHEVSLLKNIEEEYSNMRTQLMIEELERQSNLVSDSSNLQGRMQKSDGLNDSLKLKNKVESLVGENRLLQQQLQQKNNEIESLRILLDQNGAKITSPIQKQNSYMSEPNTMLFTANDYEFNPFESEMQQNQQVRDKTPKNGFSGVTIAIQTETIADVSPGADNGRDRSENEINVEYLKNVLFKYFLFQETKNIKEAQMLKHAIITILKISKEERMILEEAKNRGTYWQSAKSYVTDNVFCYKQGLNQHDIHGNMYPQSANPLATHMNQSNIMK